MYKKISAWAEIFHVCALRESHVALLLETLRFQYFHLGKTQVFPTPFPFESIIANT